ncbi:DUF3616 domain-containing protein [Rhodoplanes azumiensis]|uniref:DUF3616 domain-containing protein n=1 Tax=Rhodoplanes azumiensis TaxID=1897628 RepID=A0ABW5AJS0_9BRAD
MATTRIRRHRKRKTADAIGRLPVAKPVDRLRLAFGRSAAGGAKALRELRANLSGIEIAGDTVFVASDEGTSLDVLTRTGRGQVYAQHRRFPLARSFALKQTGKNTEADLEGISRDGARLWLLGSHCRIRKPDPDKAAKKGEDLDACEILSRRKTRNRHLLGCLDLDDPPDDPQAGFRPRASARLPFTDDGNTLIELLAAADPQLAPFLDLPAKENGFDLEGLAVRGDRVFVGLRGPVIAGRSLVLELGVAIHRTARRIDLVPVAGVPFAKHALPLQGLGIRDLAFRGDRLLVLAAPTMPLDGVAAVFEWDAHRRDPRGGIVAETRCRPLLRLPGGDGHGYPEGISYLPDADTIAVVVDNPEPARLRDRSGIMVDVFALPSRRR